MKKYVDENDQPYTGTIRANGYDFGDKLLEDVFFQADVTDGDIDLSTVRVDPNAADYFSGLNQKKWLKEATSFFTSYDAFETADGKDDIFLDDPDKAAPQPVAIENVNLSDLFSK